MKKLITLVAIITLAITSVAVAKDTIIDLKVSKIITKQDKNGDDFKILIVKIPQNLNGTRYEGSMPIMAFSDTLDLVANLEVGQNLKAVVSIRPYQGRDSATLIAILP